MTSLTGKQRRAAEELARRRLVSQRVSLEDMAFGPQRAFLEDKSPLKAALCSRRAGKTYGVGLDCVLKATQHRYTDILYITLSRPQAKRNFWPILAEIDRDLNLNLEFNNADLTARVPSTGSTIWLGGANDAREIQRYRGMKSPLVIIDEAQDFRGFLEYFIEEILEPVVLDMAGQIALTGTPNAACFGFFHDATTGAVPGWSVHHWTVLDNPKIEEKHGVDPKGFLIRRAARLERGWDDPKFRREYRGEWVRDSEGLIYLIDADLNVQTEYTPSPDALYVLGMDVGYKDATAFVVAEYSVLQGTVTFVESYERTKLIPSKIAVEVEQLNARYDFADIVIDPGGGGKFIIEELTQRYGIGARVAQKAAKIAAIEMLNGDLRNGSVKVYKTGNLELLESLFTARWDESRAKKKTLQVDGRYIPIDALQPANNVPDHLTDAALYAYRACHAYLREDEENAPLPGSKEALREEEKELLAKREARISEEAQAAQEEAEFLYGDAYALEALFQYG